MNPRAWFFCQCAAASLLLFGRSALLAQSVLNFETANKLYYEGKFPDAASAYEKLIKSGQVSATLYFNLGNALFKSGQVGRAIVAYRQAEQLNPRDPDVRANLRFARNQVQGPTLSSNRLNEWLARLTLNEWTLAAAAGLWSLFLLLIFTQLRPDLKRTLRPLAMLSLIAAILLAASAGYCFSEQRVAKTATVIVPDALVRHGPLDTSPNAFTVHDGAELRVLGQLENWLQVSPDPARIGWIPREEVVVW